jgi:hypothetical protein
MLTTYDHLVNGSSGFSCLAAPLPYCTDDPKARDFRALASDVDGEDVLGPRPQSRPGSWSG